MRRLSLLRHSHASVPLPAVSLQPTLTLGTDLFLKASSLKSSLKKPTCLKGAGFCSLRVIFILSSPTHFPKRCYATTIFEEQNLQRDEMTNVNDRILGKIGVNLHKQAKHPLNIIKNKIENYFIRLNPGNNNSSSSSSSTPTQKKKLEISENSRSNSEASKSTSTPTSTSSSTGSLFRTFDDFGPVVTVQQNFDELLFPMDHVGRKPTDTYYVNRGHVLRTHTTAHQTQLLRAGHRAFLVTGDVYRRDEIDSTHYPVFHQMDGVRIFSEEELDAAGARSLSEKNKFVEMDMKSHLEGMVNEIFGKVQVRWVDAFFPFTDPSWEMEIFFENRWLEVLGCGLIQHQILESCNLRKTLLLDNTSEKEKKNEKEKEKEKEKEIGKGNIKEISKVANSHFPENEKKQHIGWAFGLGLERLAMVLFDIPDIRLFWSKDPRFLGQFTTGEIVKFQSYSKYPPCPKDIAFWVTPEFHENAFFELVGQIAGDLVESVRLVDQFVHPKTQQRSLCFRITYRSMDRSLTNEEINELQSHVREQVTAKLGVTLR